MIEDFTLKINSSPVLCTGLFLYNPPNEELCQKIPSGIETWFGQALGDLAIRGQANFDAPETRSRFAGYELLLRIVSSVITANRMMAPMTANSMESGIGSTRTMELRIT